MKKFPTIGEYNQAIQKRGSLVFRANNGITLIPSRLSPIKIYLFGSGAYAVVFKGSKYGKTFALRCFLNTGQETMDRYKMICNYLQNINSSWITPSEFLDNEIEINGNLYPVLKMEWVDGLLINDFVTRHISEKSVLTELQKQLVKISHDLEENQIGHGDLQCGNIIVTGSSTNFKIRLIDYDGMFAPNLVNQKSLENGRSEFQHPDRTAYDFHPRIDRFSIWVIITALEALKFDITLWHELMQGGFNTLDNFLFTVEDFKNPNNSKLFNRLLQLRKSSLDFYVDKLSTFCRSDINSTTAPELQPTTLLDNSPSSHITYTPNFNTTRSDANKNYQIITNEAAFVLTSTFKKIGSTPLELDKSIYHGKTIVVSNGKKTKQILLNSERSLIELTFT